MNDKAIEFEAANFKTIKVITKLKETGLNVAKFEKSYNEIINECNNDTKSVPLSFNESPTNFAISYMEISYNKAIRNLELLLLEMSKYEIYVQVFAFTKYIKRFIDNPTKTNSDFIMYRDSLVDILNKLLKSQTLDYDVEGSIVDDIYQITYYFILEEIKFMGISKTLEYIKYNQVHLSHIDKQIHQTLETMNLSDSRYSNLVKTLSLLDAQGINSNYVNENLLRQLASFQLNYEKVSELIEQLLAKINDNIKELDEVDKKINSDSNKHKDKYKIKSIRKNLFKNITLFITSGSLLAGMVFGCIKLSKDRKYNSTIKIFTSKNEITSQTNYDFNSKNSTTIYELTPYEKKYSHDYYSRTKTTYDVTEIENIPIEEYLYLDLISLGIEGKTETQKKSELELGDLYEEPIRYVRQIEVDKTDYQEMVNPLSLSGLIFASILLEILMEVVFIKSHFSDKESVIALISAMKRILSDMNDLSSEKKNKEEIKKGLLDLNEQCEQLINANKQIIKKLMDYYKIIKDNPDYAQEIKKIDDTIKLVRRKMNNENN